MKKNIAASYNKAKEFQCKRYTGMAVGRTHHWYYDQADWKEKKVTPEKWEFSYHTTKRRAGKAPEGSGVPVGTGYHWFILAHQYVEKLNANDYLTQMVGLKYKLAHKRAGGPKWNATGEVRRKHLVEILTCIIGELERDPEQLVPVPLALKYQGQAYEGSAMPVPTACSAGACFELDVMLNNEHLGLLRRQDNGSWKLSGSKSTSLAKAIGAEIEAWYRK